MLFADPSLDNLLDLTQQVDEIAPAACGPVHYQDGEFRWLVTTPPQAWPPHRPDGLGRRIGEHLYAMASRAGPSSLRELRDLLDLRGWLFAGTAVSVDNPWPASEGSLADHPDQRPVLLCLYLDQENGTLTQRMNFADGAVDLQTIDRPEAGWLPERGTLPAALDLMRAAAGPARAGR